MSQSKRRRMITAALARSAAAMLLTAGALSCTRKPDLALPAQARHEALPRAFDAALERARQDANDSKKAPEAVRTLARLYHANGFFRDARACYRSLAAIQGEFTARDRYYLADIARNESDLAAAQEHLNAVVRLAPNYLPARLALAEVVFKSGGEKEAAGHYAAVLEREPNHPQAAVGLARLEIQRGQEDAALARLEELMAAHPESVAAAGLLAQLLERRGETDRAIALKQWSTQKPEPYPSDPWMNELWGDLYDVQRLGLKFEDYFKTGQVAEATAFLKRIEELDGKSPLPHLLRGWSASQSLRHGEAGQYYREALAKGGDAEKICPYLVQSLLALNQVNEAATLMAGVYAKMPDSVPVLTAYSDVALRQGDEKLARMLLSKLLEKEPFLQPQNMSLAKILWSSGEQDAAAVCLERVASVAPEHIPSRALLGEYFLSKGDAVKAQAPLEQAITHAKEKTPEHDSLSALLGAAYLRAGQAAAEKGDLVTTVAQADKLIRRFPADLRGYALKANGCVQLGQFRPAAEALAKMSELQPKNPTIQLSLGDVVYQAGDAAQARRHWEKARQLVGQGDAQLRAALEERLNGRIGPETFK